MPTKTLTRAPKRWNSFVVLREITDPEELAKCDERRKLTDAYMKVRRRRIALSQLLRDTTVREAFKLARRLSDADRFRLLRKLVSDLSPADRKELLKQTRSSATNGMPKAKKRHLARSRKPVRAS